MYEWFFSMNFVLVCELYYERNSGILIKEENGLRTDIELGTLPRMYKHRFSRDLPWARSSIYQYSSAIRSSGCLILHNGESS